MTKHAFWTASFQCLAKSLIPCILVVFTRQLEILETTLGSPLNYGIIWLSLRVSGAVPKVNVYG